jgi:hypothetical protein
LADDSIDSLSAERCRRGIVVGARDGDQVEASGRGLARAIARRRIMSGVRGGAL